MLNNDANDAPHEPTLNDLFPASGRLLLTGSGKEFIERVGVEVARKPY